VQHRHLLSNEIDLLLDGEAGFGVAPLRAHVDDCADCRTRLEEARVVADALERLPHFAPRPGFSDRVLSQVQIVEPWQVAALDTARRFVPESRPLRVLALAGVGVSSVAISASAVWIALSADLTIGSATVMAGLDAEELARFKELLAFPDNDLLDLVMGRTAAPDRRYDAILRLLQAA
jgi:hypothetical protein